ncbi:hypothetical protein BC937DRAFT_86724 [Endogone sp. FLAS-F59071]|nr:hypothetical protein BC937DRAFT_86724 [Endogone sp. FLAS-F59071]|eukprot:RUS12911.1 hypothetical protein BC937DRAFT_86724 [Endogone sp. FLAS-F59071]
MSEGCVVIEKSKIEQTLNLYIFIYTFFSILPLYEYHSRLHILPHLRDKNKENRHDESEDPPSTSQGPPPDSILKEHHDALSFIAAQDIETEPWSFDSLYDHRQPTPPLVGSIRIRMRYAYQHPRIDQQDVDYWMPVLSDNASLLSVDPDDDDASSITSDVTSEAGSDIGSMYSELELGEGDHHEPRVWETDNRSEAADDANTDGQEIRPEDMVRDENVVEKEFEAKLSEALEKSRGRHPLDTSDVKTDGTKPPQDRDSRPPSRSNSRPTSPPLNGIDMNGSILSRTASNASQRAPPHREGSITPSVIDLLQYGFSRRDADARSMAGDSVHSSSTDFSIRSGVFADKDFAKKWMMDSFEEAVMANPTMDWMIGMVVSPETRTLLRAVSKLASAFVSFDLI